MMPGAADSPSSAVRPRLVWVDAARCIAMFFIIWLHTGKSPAWNGDLVGGALCLFFFLAGYFMPSDAGRCAARAWRMLRLWVLWSFLSAGLYMLTKSGAVWSWERVFGIGVGAYNTPLWFLRNLAVYQLLVAGGLALRWLPRHTWLVTALLAAFAYTCEHSQHTTLRFDWMMVLVLGVSLRTAVTPEQLTGWLRRRAAVLVVAAVVLLVQIHALPKLGRELDVAVRSCSLPVESLAWALLYALAAMGIEHWCSRAGVALAACGRSMLFCYITHSFALAVFYNYPSIDVAANVWVPVLLLVVLTLLNRMLEKRFPRTMRFLFSC